MVNKTEFENKVSAYLEEQAVSFILPEKPNINTQYLQIRRTKRYVKFVPIVALIALISVLIIAVMPFDKTPNDNIVKYKRISLSAQSLGDKDSVLNNVISASTKIEYKAKETFSNTMPIYEITPREISEEEISVLAKELDINGEIQTNEDSITIKSNEGSDISIRGNYVMCSFDILTKTEMTQSDDEIIDQAKVVVDKLSLLEGDYECLGVVSEITETAGEKEYVVAKQVSFRKKLDDVRVIGNEICDVYFNSDGLCDIRIELYNYEIIGEMEMVSLEDAIAKIKTPDAFTTNELNGTAALTRKADVLSVERVKLIYVNQYLEGCTIIQPVYNFIGIAKAGDEAVEFQSRVIAIPEKYTYTE